MVRTAIVGLGKMGISHLALARAHPEVDLTAVCDNSSYLLSAIEKNTGLATWSDYDRMLDEVELDALVLATPSASHGGFVRKALERNLSVFCEKPFTLDPKEGEALASTAEAKGLVNQVGYHYRFVGAFQEAKRLIDSGAIGSVSLMKAEAYGPVVLKAKGSTWRSRKSEGGGALYDYAAHPVNLVNWYLGMPSEAVGSILNPIFSRETDDEVLSTLIFDSGKAAQVAVNWSDESQRKMATTITAWGEGGWIQADRQECRAFLRGTEPMPDGYEEGWNVRYTTDLTEPVWFYLRGEEYSAQIDHFVRNVAAGAGSGQNDFRSANETDRVLDMIVADASGEHPVDDVPRPGMGKQGRRRRLLARRS